MYGYTRRKNSDFETVVSGTRNELGKEGFGVLTEIDIKATLKKKLNVDYNNYIILGACNPPFAYKALQAEEEIGLLLPCNVIIYENNKGVFVSAIKPTIAMNFVNNSVLKQIAEEVEEKLKKVIDRV